jgi:hypothetical protein
LRLLIYLEYHSGCDPPTSNLPQSGIMKIGEQEKNYEK